MSSTYSLLANWNYPTQIRIGAGRLKELPESCAALGITSPLLVTDPGLVQFPMIHQAIKICKDADLRVNLFSQIKANPIEQNVRDGIDAYHTGKHDGVIAMGGGSALDAAKAIALMIGQQKRPIWDFEDVGDNWKRVNVTGMAPVIAIPTTAGTGSEVGRASVITDPVRQLKTIIFHPNMMPKIVILDPEVTRELPPALTAATGMDALAHNLEAYCSPFYHPMAEGIALEGIRLVKDNLLRVVQDGEDLEARCQMLVASSMGATAFQRGLGAMHALAHPLGALYDAHHGRLNAILMPYVLMANRPAIDSKIERLAAYLSINNGFDGFLNWLLTLRKNLAIEHSLSQLGVWVEQPSHIAKMATEDAAAGGNPIAFSRLQYEQILMAAIEGDLNQAIIN
ncbi:iron-containing alcohol dehydrogenase [Legionella impletisoli]|uniref:Alcohol dehydrogenase n=1 Tax=Legionella impletisoli TaxID=343510 RepID=A0A917N8T5_9GAMM|nr:iron-containing alcohol dehydrogenase [Legionella impletisoli]GGI77335.1 alcohol dehydrogenase [Legionella impletisoli]